MSRPRKLLTKEAQFCLLGWLASGDSVTAYRLAHNSQSGDPLNLQKMASRWLNRPEVKEFCEARRKANYQAAKEEHATASDNRTRGDAVAELNLLISSTDDPKLRSDLLLKLADLQRWKTAEQATEDRRVIFYIPMQLQRGIETFAYCLKEHFGMSDDWAEEAITVMRKLPMLRGMTRQ